MAVGLVISNQNEVEFNAIELIGATSKEGQSDKIGMFGSGMKYAIAAALRHGIEIRIATQGKVVKFKTKPERISPTTTVNRVVMQIGQSNREMSWTTDLGRKDWRHKPEEGVTVEWMIVREIVSNAFDEGDAYFSRENGLEPESGHTKVWVEMTPGVADVYENMGEYFLSKSDRMPLKTTDRGAIYNKRPNRNGRIYHKGVFIREIEEELLYDYNLHSLALTESRSVDVWNLRNSLAYTVATVGKDMLTMFFRALQGNSKAFEASVDFRYYLRDDVRKEFTAAFKNAFGNDTVLTSEEMHASPFAAEALMQHGKRAISLPETWRNAFDSEVPTVFSLIGQRASEGYEELDRDKAYDRNPGRVLEIERVYAKVSEFFNSKPELRFFVNHGTGTSLGYGGSFGVAITLAAVNERELHQTMIEEFAHYMSGASDYSRALVDFLTGSIADTMITVNQ